MNFTYKFEKILSIRTREKEEAMSTYQNAVKKFEEVAEKLYQLLKKKEEVEEDQLEKIQKGLSVQEIRLLQQYLSNLQKEIDYYQQLVIRARNKMNYERERLIEKNIEVKKFEKIKEKEYQLFLEIQKNEQAKFLDEISSQITARGK